jgi:hypothetical protein
MILAMARAVLCVASICSAAIAQADAYTVDVEQIELDGEEVFETENMRLQSARGDWPFLIGDEESRGNSGLKVIAADGSTVVNTGDSNWDIIANGKTVLGFQFRSANALPVSVRSERRLTDWSDLVGSRFTLTAKNYLGFEVHRIQFDVTYRYGGRLASGGRYIGSINVTPRETSKSLGHWMSMRVCDVNVGPRSEHEKNIAVAELHICYDAMSYLDKKSRVISLRIDGENGDIEEVRD